MRKNLSLLLLLTACASTAVVYRNNYGEGEAGSLTRLATWQWERLSTPSPTAGVDMKKFDGLPFPLQKPETLTEKDTFAATWIGHATVLLRSGKLNILTDPILSERASPVGFAGPKRFMPPAHTVDTLPHIDVVVVSHNHYDHLDLPTVQQLAKQKGGSPLYLVGKGLAAWFKSNGMTNVRELNWWESIEFGEHRFTFTPVQHWSKRTLFDAYETLWGGWVSEQLGGEKKRFFTAGDTGYSADFIDIGKRFPTGFDLAALPIGAYAPAWFMAAQHINPSEAVKIMQNIGARQAIAMHWGTFVLTDEPIDEPPKLLSEALAKANIPAQQFLVLKHGETWR